MTEAEVIKMVQREVLQIKKRDGTLPKTPYLWAEVSTRLATLKPWAGMRAGDTIGRALRPLVEAVALHEGSFPSPDDPVGPQHMPPFDAATTLGSKKNRHMRGPRDQPAPV